MFFFDPSLRLLGLVSAVQYFQTMFLQLRGQFASTSNSFAFVQLLVASLNGLVCRHVLTGQTDLADFTFHDAVVALLHVLLEIVERALLRAPFVFARDWAVLALFLRVMVQASPR